MKRKLLIASTWLLLGAPLAFCGFGIPGLPEIVFDPKSWADLEQDIQALSKMIAIGETTRATIQNMEGAFKTGNWQMAMQGAMMGASLTTQELNMGANSAALQRLNKNLQLANLALQESSMISAMGGHPSTGNAMMMTMVLMQQADAQMKRDQLAVSMNYQEQVKQYRARDTSFSDVQDLNNWRVQQ